MLVFLEFLIKVLYLHVSATTFKVSFYEAGGYTGTGSASEKLSVFIYGSEFKKGTAGMDQSLEPFDTILRKQPYYYQR